MTSEFIDAPTLSGNLYSSKKPTLTNITDSTIALQMFDRDGVLVNPKSGSIYDSIVQFTPSEFVFYDDIVVQQTTSADYNVPKIDSYIQNKILSETLTSLPVPTSQISTISGTNHTLSVSANGLITKLVSQNTVNSDHTQVYTAVDVNNNIACIVYRDKQGLSYSLDNGRTIIPIDNNGLLYPLEITSVAIQVYSGPLLDRPSPKIYVGTLREGIKAFAPGDLAYTWADGMDSYVKLETGGTHNDGIYDITVDTVSYQVQKIQFLFKHSIATDSTVKPTIDNPTGLYLSHYAGDFAPVYILGIINSPVDAGNPLICYVRSNIEDYTSLGTYNKITRYVSYNLREDYVNLYFKDMTYGIYRTIKNSVFNTATVTKAQKTALDSLYGPAVEVVQIIGAYDDTSRKYTIRNRGFIDWTLLDYTGKTVVLKPNRSGWKVLQETFNAVTVRNPYSAYTVSNYCNLGLSLSVDLPVTLVDIIKTVGIYSNSDITSTLSGIVTAINNNSTTSLIKITATPSLDDTLRSLFIDVLPACSVLPKDITGFTSYWTNDTTQFQLFITTSTKVRRYYSNTWTDFIVSNSWDIDNQTINLQLTKYLYTFYNPKTDTPPVGSALSTDIKTHLIGLREFSLFSIGNNQHIGIMGSDLGYVTTHFIKKIDDFVSPMSDFREFRLDLYSSWSTCITCVPEARKLISCGLEKHPPMIYDLPAVNTSAPIRYYLYDPTADSVATSKNGIKSKIFYKNYGTTGETQFYFFNKYNSQYFQPSEIHFDQLLSNVRVEEFIKVVPQHSDADTLGIKYAADALNSTPYVFLTTAGINNDTTLANYLITNPNKYKHLKFLLRTTQYLSPIWDEITSSTDTTYTYFLQN